MDVATPKPGCLSLQALPSHIKPRYRRLALVTDQRQVDRLNAGDDDTLIVSCDWLLWQKAAAAGRHCVYYELGIAEWTEPDRLDSELMIRSNQWIYEAGEDPTQFHGVSLGKLFHSEMLFCHINYLRLERSLLKLIERFSPEDVRFYDFANDINIFDKAMRRQVVRAIAEEQGLAFTDASDAGDDDALTISENILTLGARPGGLRRLLVGVYASVLEVATSLRTGISGRPRVLLLLGGNVAEPLIRNFRSQAFTPIFQARTVPRKLSLLLGCLARGVRLVAPKDMALTGDDIRRLDAIRNTLEARLSRPARGIAAIANRFLSTHFLVSGRIRALAAEVLKAEGVLEACRPRRIVVDGVRNPPPRIFVELAHRRGIAVDYIWHSPMVPQYLKFDALGGDPNTRPMVSRCLTWGPINEAWLDAVEAAQPRVRVGSPLSDRYQGWKTAPAPRQYPSPRQRNVLVLQYAPIISDLKSLNANLYNCFVELVSKLRQLGYANVRFKLHPGPGRWKKSYFQSIADFFGLNCEILKTELFPDCLAWADVVIGPAQTGALFETLAAGKPYYAYMLPPHSFDPSCYQGYPVLSSVDDVIEAMEGKDAGRGRRLLDDLYSTTEFPSGAERFWQVLDADF